MDLGFRGQKLLFVKVDYSVILEFSDKYFVTLECPFSLRTPEGTRQLSPETDPDENFAPIRELIGVDVTRSSADDSGILEITFANDVTIHSEPDGSYEAWNVAGPRGMKVVSMPSGGLTTWSPDPGGDS
jgi:hypothetical protein